MKMMLIYKISRVFLLWIILSRKSSRSMKYAGKERKSHRFYYFTLDNVQFCIFLQSLDNRKGVKRWTINFFRHYKVPSLSTPSYRSKAKLEHLTHFR